MIIKKILTLFHPVERKLTGSFDLSLIPNLYYEKWLAACMPFCNNNAAHNNIACTKQ